MPFILQATNWQAAYYLASWWKRKSSTSERPRFSAAGASLSPYSREIRGVLQWVLTLACCLFLRPRAYFLVPLTREKFQLSLPHPNTSLFSIMEGPVEQSNIIIPEVFSEMKPSEKVKRVLYDLTPEEFVKISITVAIASTALPDLTMLGSTGES